jgi:sarcosine oxidase subunit beta
VRSGIEELLPALAHVSFPVLARGEYDVTPDHQPILGRVGDGLYVAAGFSGHGFMIAPAVARIVAEAVTGTATDETLGILDVARFEENRPVPEPQLV